MEVKQYDSCKKLKLAEKLGVSEDECRMEWDDEKKILSVSFDKHKVQVPSILNMVMEISEIF